MKIFKYFLFSFLFLTSCKRLDSIKEYEKFNNDLKLKYASDSRVAIYSVTIEKIDDTIFVKGETNSHLAINEFLDKLKNDNIIYKNEVELLPNSSVGNNIFAIVNNSVANIRSNPSHSAELATQAILGTELKVYKYAGYYYLVQTPDNYISWVDKDGIILFDEKTYLDWKESKKIIYTHICGNVYEDVTRNVIISDIVLGAQLKLLEIQNTNYKVQFPDERIGYVRKDEAYLYDEWLTNLVPSKDLIENYARKFLGSPYLWGGTSSKGMDCSGFVKTVYLMNGFVIPRDASQQFYAGKKLDKNLRFEGLEKGDLLFFGKKAIEGNDEKVTHVGIWLGNGRQEFIHSSGRVRLNSVAKTSNDYNDYLVNNYLGSRRYLGVQDSLIINLKKD